MLKAGCPLMIVQSLMKYYETSAACIEIDGDRSEIFSLTIGVISCIEELDYGVSIGSERIYTVMYADDDFIISSQETHMHQQLNAITEYANENGLEINAKKTKFLTSADIITKNPQINGTEIEQVNQFKYLGVEIIVDAKHLSHITKRRSLAYAAVAQLTQSGFTSPSVNAQVKSRMLTTFIRPVITYGLENCDLSSGLIDRIRSTEANILKKLLNLPRYVRTTPIYGALRIQPIDAYIKHQKLNFFNMLMGNEYTCKVLKQMSANCFDFCFLGYRKQLSYSLLDLKEEADRQSIEIKSNKKVCKDKIREEYEKINKLFELKPSTEERFKLIEALWPTNGA
jgi:hypothetical protein